MSELCKQLVPKIETLEKALLGLEERIRDLEARTLSRGQIRTLIESSVSVDRQVKMNVKTGGSGC